MRRALLALMLYSLITGFIFAPVLGRFTTHCLAHPQGEVSVKLWDQGRTADGLARTGRLPVETTQVSFPRGGTLFPSDPLNCLVFHPVFMRFGAAARYNAAPMAHLVLNAMAAFFLALYLTGSTGGALLAGAAFGFSPYLLSYGIESGSSEAVCAAGFPLLLLFAIRTVVEPGLANPLLAAGSLLFLLVCSNYYGVFGMLLLFVLGLYVALVARRPQDLSLRDDPSTEDQATDVQASKARPSQRILLDRGLLARLAVFTLVAVMLAGPFTLAVYRTVSTPRSVLPRERLGNRTEGVSHLRPTEAGHTWTGVLSDLVRPGKESARLAMVESRFVRVTYSGIVLLGLAAYSLRRRRRFLRFVAGATVLFGLLFLGPYLQVTDQLYTSVPMNPVFLGFFYAFPLFGMVLEPFRLHIVITLLLSLMAARGLADLAGRRDGLAVGCAAALLVTAEYLWLSPLPFPLSVTELDQPTYCRVLREDPRPYAVIDLPVHFQGTQLFYKRVLYCQTLHGRPIPNNVAFLPPLLDESAVYRALLVMAEDAEPRSDDHSLTVDELDAEFTALEKLGFGRIVVHTDAMKPQLPLKVGGFLHKRLGRPVYTDDTVQVYDLPTLFKDDARKAP